MASGSNEVAVRASRRIAQLPIEFEELKNRTPRKKNQYKRSKMDKQKQQDESNTTGVPTRPEPMELNLEKISIFPEIKIKTPEAPKEFWDEERTALDIVVREMQRYCRLNPKDTVDVFKPIIENTMKFFLWTTGWEFKDQDLEPTEYVDISDLPLPVINNITAPEPWIKRHWVELCDYLRKGMPLDTGLGEMKLLPDWANDEVPEIEIEAPKIEPKDKDPNTETQNKNTTSDKKDDIDKKTKTSTIRTKKSVEERTDEDDEEKPDETEFPPEDNENDPDDSDPDESDNNDENGNWRMPRRNKSKAQKLWERTTGRSACVRLPIGSKKLLTKIPSPEVCDGIDKKWKDVEHFDNWSLNCQRYLVFNQKEVESLEALDLFAFWLQGGPMTVYNQYMQKVERGEIKGNLLLFMLELRKFLTPTTSNETLWKRWENTSIIENGKYIGVWNLAKRLNELQIKITDEGEEAISDLVKRQKFKNALTPELHEKLLPRFNNLKNWDRLVEAAEQYESAI